MIAPVDGQTNVGRTGLNIELSAQFGSTLTLTSPTANTVSTGTVTQVVPTSTNGNTSAPVFFYSVPSLEASSTYTITGSVSTPSCPTTPQTIGTFSTTNTNLP